MNKRRITSFTLSLISCTLAVANIMLPAINGDLSQRAYAARPTVLSATGLDSKSLQLSNQGNWIDLCDRLKSETAEATSPSVSQAWLAFGYMFLDKCEDLSSLSQKVDSLAAADPKSDVPKVVQLFNLICQKKLADADKLASSLTENGDSKQVIVDLALAAVSAKNGAATKAIDYCNKAIALAPDFAWGYRTIGFIEERTLKDNPACRGCLSACACNRSRLQRSSRPARRPAPGAQRL